MGSALAGSPVTLSDSIRAVAPNPSAQAPFSIVRTALSAGETAQRLDLEVALRMRNFPELLARISRREAIGAAEMAARYHPQAADRDRVAAWLKAQGLTIAPTESRLAVFASGTVEQIARAFQVSFARVRGGDGEYTSALTAPAVPADLAPLLLGVNGLQPHSHPHSRIIFGSSLTGNGPPYLPGQIALAYGGSGLTVNGAGETIAIVIDTFPANSDLTTFWSVCGIGQSLANIAAIQVVSGTLPAPSGEETLDVEWSSGIASGAKVRIYATTDLAFVHLDEAYAAIYSDLSTYPTLHEMSLSYGANEDYVAPSQLETDSQYFAELAAAGVTVVVSSGDGGSSPGTNGQTHDGPIQAETPASDPNVTAVGGTTLSVNATTGLETSESAWYGSGGGYSGIFSRPTWQNFSGAPAGTTRMVPDVAAAADPNTGALIVLNGLGYRVGGTSWSAPTWAGFCALINQSRIAAGLNSLGLMGPQIYPLLGTTSFRDIVSGDNGPNNVYDATDGYDLCTGIGVPNLANLLPMLSLAPPTVSVQPSSVSLAAGQNATITVTATGYPAPTFQWQVSTDGGQSWTNLSNSAPYSGTGTDALQITAVGDSLNGTEYRCQISNSQGTVASAPAELFVESGGDTPALPLWAQAVLAALLALAGAFGFRRVARAGAGSRR